MSDRIDWLRSLDTEELRIELCMSKHWQSDFRAIEKKAKEIINVIEKQRPINENWEVDGMTVYAQNHQNVSSLNKGMMKKCKHGNPIKAGMVCYACMKEQHGK